MVTMKVILLGVCPFVTIVSVSKCPPKILSIQDARTEPSGSVTCMQNIFGGPLKWLSMGI